MSSAFGDVRTLPASNLAKKQMKQLVAKDIFDEQRDVWTLGAALGIALGETYERGNRGTFQNVNSLDPERIFSAVMFGLYPNASPKERAKKLVDHAEWGIREIFRRERNGTLDFEKLSEYGWPSEKPGFESRGKSEGKKEHRVDVTKLIREGESARTEFKASLCWDYEKGQKSRIMELAVAKTVSAFMNSDGGNLIIGVGDDKRILGLDKDFAILKRSSTDAFELHFTNIINNYLGKENRSHVRIRFEELSGKEIAVVTVLGRAPNPVYVSPSKGEEEFYVRLGNSSHPMNVREATLYIKEHFVPPRESQ